MTAVIETSFNYNGLFDKTQVIQDIYNLADDESMSMIIKTNVPHLLIDNMTKQVFNIGLDQFIEYQPDSFINLKLEADEYLPVYYAKTQNRTVYYLDIQRIKYSQYENVFTVLDYLTRPNSIVAQNKILIIVNNLSCLLIKYIYKFYKYIETLSSSHYFIFVTTSLPSKKQINWGKLLTLLHNIHVMIDIDTVADIVETNYNIKKIIHGKIKSSVFKNIITTGFKLFDFNPIKLDIYIGHILTLINDNPTTLAFTDKQIHDLLLPIPIIKMFSDFISKVRRIRQITDLSICYDMAYKLNSFNYTPAYACKTLIRLLTSSLPLGEFSSLKPRVSELVQLFADLEKMVTVGESDYIVIYQNLLIGIAKIAV